MSVKNLFGYLFAIILLNSCVTGRQFQEIKTLSEELEVKNESLNKKNDAVTTENIELKSKNDDLLKSINALKSDTTILGTSLRHMKNQYDKINELNEMLSSKGSQLLDDAAGENRKLLAQLETTRLELQRKEDALRILETDLNKLETDLNEKEGRLDKLTTDLEGREQKVIELQELIAQKDAAAQALKQTVTNALLGFKDKGLTIEERNGKVYVGLEASILFPSGSTKIGKDGTKALIDLAKAIEDQSDMGIVVEGHTDTDQLKSSNHPKDNWELSALRSTAVVKIMTENSSLSPTVLSASGRGEFHPVSDDKAKNRRIEIVLSPNLGELFDLIED